jgi:GNAT superfamily N-acetyltransferase
MSTQHIRLSAFDAEAFAVPFYRVHEIDPASIEQELEAVRKSGKAVVVDAKVPADDLEGARLLWSLGFRKVCMQIMLRYDLRDVPVQPSGTTVTAKLDLPESDIRQHAENFTYDRFSLDPLLPREGIRRLYSNWVRNSLTGGRKQIVHSGASFCTLAINDRTASIDLVSVLNRGQGIGKALVAGALQYARQQGAKEMFVTTECENTRAWGLYQRAGFVPAKYTSAFHLVQQ